MELQARSVRCVVQGVSGSTVTLRDHTTIYRVQVSAIATDSGFLTSADDIHPGDSVQAETINSQFQSARIVPLDLLAAYSREVRLYSSSIFPISVLAHAYAHNRKSEDVIGIIAARCIACRKMSTKPDFSLWSALAVGFIEHIARQSTPTQLFDDFRERMSERNDTIEFAEVMRSIEKLRNIKEKGMNVGSWMVAKCIAEEFWTSAGRFLKQACIDFARKSGGNVGFLGGISVKIGVSLIDNGELEVCLKTFANAFRIKIVVFQPNIVSLKNKYIPEGDISSSEPCLYLFRDVNRFHILYTLSQIENEGLNPITLRCETRGNEPPTNLMDENLRLLYEFSIRAQTLILSLFDSLSQRQLSILLSDTSIDDLIEFSNEINRFAAYFPQGDNSTRAPEITYYLSLILEKLISLDLICSFCRKSRPILSLQCNHKPCIDCLKTYIESIVTAQPCLITTLGRPTPNLKCISEHCYVPIPIDVFQSIVNPDWLDSAISAVNRISDEVECALCEKRHPKSTIHSVCNCDYLICNCCYSDILRSSDRKCICGTVLSEDIYYRFDAFFNAKCPSCNGCQSMLSGFTSVKCESHRVCRACLDANFAVHIAKCPYCFRPFTIEEIDRYRS